MDADMVLHIFDTLSKRMDNVIEALGRLETRIIEMEQRLGAVQAPEPKRQRIARPRRADEHMALLQDDQCV